MDKHKKDKYIRLGCLGILSLVIIVPAYFLGVPYAMSMNFTDEDLLEFQDVALEAGAPELGPDELPYRTGKVLVIVPEVWKIYREFPPTRYSTSLNHTLRGKKDGVIDPVRIDGPWFSLDSEIRASNADEVDTLVVCEYGSKRVGVYVGEGGAVIGDARQNWALVKVYDVKTGTFIGQYTIDGGFPAMSIDWYEARYGGAPKIVDFINEMPLQE